MNPVFIEKEKRDCLWKLTGGWQETLIWSCLQGCMGHAWADKEENPQTAQLIIGDFCFLVGKPKKEFVLHRPLEIKSDFIIMVPDSDRWAELMEDAYGASAKKVKRYAIKKEPGVFDLAKLEGIVAALDKRYTLQMIDENLFHKTGEQAWSADLCSQFESYEDYEKRGIGAVILEGESIVSGASSYTVYKEGIEIEIDTKKEARRRGLALVCGAKLILECTARGLYPSWDAQNKDSVALAEKLGYHYEKDYTAYEITSFGTAGSKEGEVTLVPVTDENRNTLLKLKTAKGQENRIETVKECLQEAEHPVDDMSWETVGIYSAGTAVGFSMYGICRKPRRPEEDEVWLDRLLIDGQYQGKGYGKQAITLLLERLKQTYGCDKIYLSVYEENEPAIRLYRQFGFQFNGKRDTKGEKIMERQEA